MPEKFKDRFFTSSSIKELGNTIKQLYSDFDIDRFISLIFDDKWNSLELLAKMHHTTKCLHKTLPVPYKDALDILKKAAPLVKGFEALTLPDYVEIYGKQNRDLSIQALGYFTRYSTSELAIRSFIAEDPERVMSYLSTWAEDEDFNVRRLASEGCRPRLPWAMSLPGFKKDPNQILPILEKLKNDESDYVRRSVSNNLNDISKDHPDLVLDICEKWYGKTDNTDKIVKHACRTMLKAGNKRALMLFGYCDPAVVSVENFKLNKKTLKIGKDLGYSFDLIVMGKENVRVRLEYALYFLKANGKLSRKVFKITEGKYDPGKYEFSRKHSFRNMSTRRHYAGTHQISIIVNGEEKGKISFELRKSV